MTEADAKAKFERIIKLVRAEKKMRQFVFRDQPDKLARKVAEMDELERLVTEFKDALKPHLEAEFEQPALIDVPKRAKYS